MECLKQELKECKGTVRDQTQRVQELQAVLGVAQSENAALVGRVTELEATMLKARTEESSLKQKITDLSAAVRRLEDKLKVADVTAEELERKVKCLRRKCDDMEITPLGKRPMAKGDVPAQDLPEENGGEEGGQNWYLPLDLQ